MRKEDNNNKEKAQDTIIEHRESKNFGNYFANGAISSTVSDEIHHIVFYSDILITESETGIKEKTKKDGREGVQVRMQSKNMKPIREDQCRVIMTESGMRALYNLLHRSYGPKK